MLAPAKNRNSYRIVVGAHFRPLLQSHMTNSCRLSSDTGFKSGYACGLREQLVRAGAACTGGCGWGAVEDGPRRQDEDSGHKSWDYSALSSVELHTKEYGTYIPTTCNHQRTKNARRSNLLMDTRP
jgi:hypothetical protein